MLSLLSTVFLPGLATGLLEIPLSRQHDHDDGIKYTPDGPTHSQHHERAVGSNPFNVLSWGLGGKYCVNITMGTPPQYLTVQLGTGASDLYVNAPNATYCQLSSAYSDQACRGGTFNIAGSTTLEQVASSPPFSVSFVDGSNATGPFVTDVVGIGDVSFSGVQFGVADGIYGLPSNTVGFLGLGYSNFEHVSYLGGYTYPNFMDTMLHAGVINSRLYSVYLGSTSDISGSVLFGAIDTSKYADPLTTLNLLPSNFSGRINDTINQFLITITDAEMTVRGEKFSLWSGGTDGIGAYDEADKSLVVLPDPASTGWNVPPNYFNQFIVPAFPYVNFTTGRCSCDHAMSGDSVKLTFGGKAAITFDATEFIVPDINSTTKMPNDPENDCVLLIFNGSSTDTSQVLGMAFLKNMYTVFDLDNGQLSIAQAILEPNGPPHVIEVDAGADGLWKAAPSVITASRNTFTIPSAISVTTRPEVSTLPTPIGTASGLAAVPLAAQAEISTIATPPAGTARPRPISTTDSAGGSHTSTPGSQSHTGAIAGGVVGGVAGLASIGALIYFLVRKKKAKSGRVSGSGSYEVQQQHPEMQDYGSRSPMPPRYSDMESAAPKPSRGAFQETFTNDGRHELSGLR